MSVKNTKTHQLSHQKTMLQKGNSMVWYFFQKLQVVYHDKRSAPTSSFYLDFNQSHFKGDKVFGGVINFILILFFLANSVTNVV